MAASRLGSIATLAVALALCGWHPGALAQADRPQQKLDDVEKRLQVQRARQQEAEKSVEQLREELESLRKQLIDAARQTQRTEQLLTQLEKRRAEMAKQIDDRNRALAARQGQLAALLAALERLANRPPEALLAQPGAPEDTVRTAILLRQAIPTIEAMTADLKREIEQLASLREDAERNASDVRQTAGILQKEQAKVADLVGEKARLERERRQAAENDAREAEKLAAQARDLRDLLERLEIQRQQRDQAARNRARESAPGPGQAPGAGAAPGTGPQLAALPAGAAQPPGFMTEPFSATRGKLPLPAQGELVRRFGENDAQGQPSRGIVMETRAGAQIVAPYDGRIVYAGPFRGYGLLLIVEHGEGYHTLMSGLTRIDGVVGQWVLAGEPVATMGTAGRESRQLYIETRRQSQPFDPLSWYVAVKDKVG